MDAAQMDAAQLRSDAIPNLTNVEISPIFMNEPSI